jgi:hypothetical protein
MMVAMSSVPCPTCGGVLPEALYRRTIACPYCAANDPNPSCLRIDDEVLIRGDMGLELTRVTKMRRAGRDRRREQRNRGSPGRSDSGDAGE